MGKVRKENRQKRNTAQLILGGRNTRGKKKVVVFQPLGFVGFWGGLVTKKMNSGRGKSFLTTDDTNFVQEWGVELKPHKKRRAQSEWERGGGRQEGKDVNEGKKLNADINQRDGGIL